MYQLQHVLVSLTGSLNAMEGGTVRMPKTAMTKTHWRDLASDYSLGFILDTSLLHV